MIAMGGNIVKNTVFKQAIQFWIEEKISVAVQINMKKGIISPGKVLILPSE